MGLGILLVCLAIFLVVVALPALLAFFTRRGVFEIKKQKENLTKKDYLMALLEGLAYSLLTLIAIVIILCLFLYCCVDLSYS